MVANENTKKRKDERKNDQNNNSIFSGHTTKLIPILSITLILSFVCNSFNYYYLVYQLIPSQVQLGILLFVSKHLFCL